jgi:hypothetical protein
MAEGQLPRKLHLPARQILLLTNFTRFKIFHKKLATLLEITTMLPIAKQWRELWI